MTVTDTIHATCVAFEDIGVLLRGPPGSGKSDLGLRLIEAGARLVADDRVCVAAEEGALQASPPDEIAGFMELRGIGLAQLPNISRVPIFLVVDLALSGMPERLPLKSWWECFGIRVRRVEIAPFEQTAVTKIRIAAYDASGRADPVTKARSQDPEDLKIRRDRQHD
ncbi:MAG: hypothetical protein CMM16_04090 [Rhodospirillaceae bacterium]|nr:hypothetical protein [Rhodospirillaceae bacterium]